MPKRSAERALVDTNILIDATDQRRPGHRTALTLLEARPGLVLSAQVAREYLVVATRPVAANGLGMELDAALANLAEIRKNVRLLPEERPLLRPLLTLLRSHPCHGKAIHDALLVATMRVHRVGTIITSNVSHFDRFRDLVRVVAP